MTRQWPTGCPRPLQLGMHPRRQILQADCSEPLFIACSLEEWRVAAHGVGRPAPRCRQVESGRLSHLEAEVQLGTNHLTKLAKLAELTNRQNSDCQAPV